MIIHPDDIAPPDARLYPALAAAGFGPDLFHPHQDRACQLVELYTLHLALDLVRTLIDSGTRTSGATVEGLLAHHGYVAAFRPALTWLFARLTAAGIDPHGPLPESEGPAVRAACLSLEPGYAPAFALLDEAAAIYPRVARGETSGDRALFLRASLWVAYFDNRNTYYALNNRVTALTIARLLASTRPAHVLEVGAGLGSATAAILDACAAAGHLIAAYHATEPVVFFRRRAQRTLAASHPAAPLTFDGLDLDVPWAEAGITPRSRTVVTGVNVFHLARDIRASLREAHTALAPGGWLVLGEAVRATPETVIGAELPFQMLERFHAVELDPVLRPTPGFLTPTAWTAAVSGAGFTQVHVRPDPRTLPGAPPGSFTVAVCGQRPET